MLIMANRHLGFTVRVQKETPIKDFKSLLQNKKIFLSLNLINTIYWRKSYTSKSRRSWLLRRSGLTQMDTIARTSLSSERFFPQRQLSLNIAFMTARNYFQQHQCIPNSLHAIFAFIMQVLNFLELMYQGKDCSPFDTHPVAMWSSLTCLLAYCLAYGVEISFVDILVLHFTSMHFVGACWSLVHCLCYF